MKAVTFKEYGSPDALELRDVEQPIPESDEVLVKVHASSINSWDWELLRGTPFPNRLMFGLLKPKKINILGCDVAGKVVAVGTDATKFQIGDEVFGDLSANHWGGFAEYCCAPEDALALKPHNMTFAQAAAIPQAALLALQGLEKGQIESGQRVLINGAGGGVGTFAIQIAKHYSAEVTGVDSPEKLEVMRSIGADHVIDYTQDDFTATGQRYDLIFDVMAHHPVFDYKRALTPQGRYIMAGGDMLLVYKLMLLKPWLSISGNQKMSLLLHKPNEGIEAINSLFEAGEVVPIIDKRFPLHDVAEALRYFGDGHVKGKVVITI